MGPEKPITLSHIGKSYRLPLTRKHRTAIADVSLEVSTGEIFGLLGPNGAGKTTTLKVMLGLVRPDSGEGTLLGRPLGDRSARSKLGFLPEQPYFYGFMTAEKGLAFYSRFLGLERDAAAARAGELLDMVKLPRDSHLSIDKYSKGMVQRFGLAQALLGDPDLLVLDEPSSGLDPVGQKEVRDILLDFKREGRTIFLSSHQLSEVEQICDSVSIVNAGRSVRAGHVSDLLELHGFKQVVVSGGSDTKKALAHIREGRVLPDGETVFDVPEDELFRLIDAARDAGLQLVSVSTARRSLEELFMETVGADS